MSRMAQAIANDLGACVYCKPSQLLVTKDTADGAVAVSSTPIYFRKATVLGKKTLSGTNNATNVLLGWSTATNEQAYTVRPGDEVVLEAPVGAKWSLSDVVIKVATNGDGVVVIYS